MKYVLIFISIFFISCTKSSDEPQQLSDHYSKQLQNSLLHRTNFVESAEDGDLETVSRYLKLGIDANTKDSKEATALMGATLNGHKKIVELLLQHKADPSIKDQNGFSALDYAMIHERKYIVSELQKTESIYRGLSSTKAKSRD